MHYLDNAATTAVAPEVIQTITEALGCHFANPASLYTAGFEAERVIRQARAALADALGCDRDEVVFTGSGTESNNLALLGAARARRGWGSHLVTTGYEHPSGLKALEMLAVQEDFQLSIIPPGADGRIDIEEIAAAVRKDTVLVSAMQVNNETGATLDVAALAALVKQKNPRTAFHVDGVQGFMKLPLSLKSTCIDSYAVSAHKLHGPKGVGALYLRKNHNLLPVMAGGGQERGLRPGTENTAYIAGFAKAVELGRQTAPKEARAITALRARLLAGLRDLGEGIVNSPENGYAGILNVSFPGIKSESMLQFLAERGVLVSSGSACSRGEPSRTLTAMGLPAGRVDSALRISFDGSNTEADIDALLEGLAKGLARLARITGRSK